MGCGGSRTDALEPLYLESWTKETESTWLTSTDNELPLSSIQSSPSEAGLRLGELAVSEVSLNSPKSSDGPATTDPPAKEEASPTPGTRVQRTSILHTQEITKWQDNRMSTKQVTITVTQSIHQVDKNKKVKKSLTT
uniref:BAALC binder of MAP3K1 and KLF4 b n=1 Tax=Tetraodon nigroviridis TaxID=99883 RepID=H3DFZ7_TETNG